VEQEELKMKTMVRLALPALLFAMMLAAQPFGPGPGAGGTEALKSALNLTDDQIAKLRDLRKAELAALKPLLEQWRANRQALRDKVQAGGDAAEIGKLVLAGEALRKQIQESRESYHKQALAILTPAQQTALSKLEEAAKLLPAIGQARALNLLTGPVGFGRGRRGLGVGPMLGGVGPMMEGAGPMGRMGARGWRR
jgi:Spy/CpxP family protein refolding chaperone